MNKKGGLDDAVFFIVVLLALSIIFVVGNVIISKVNDEYQASSSISPIGKEISGGLADRYVGVVDGAFLTFFVGVFLAMVIGAFFIRTHPALFWLSIPILAFFIFLAAIYGNFFENFIQNEQIAETISDFTILPFIMNNYVMFIMGAIIVIVIALFAKNKTGNL